MEIVDCQKVWLVSLTSGARFGEDGPAGRDMAGIVCAACSDRYLAEAIAAKMMDDWPGTTYVVQPFPLIENWRDDVEVLVHTSPRARGHA